MLRNILKNLPRSFSAKVFTSLVITMVVITGILNIFFVRFEKARLTAHLQEQGGIITRLLAYNVRLGIFADDEAQLANAVEAALGQKDVEDVLVFNAAGELLISGVGGQGDGTQPAAAAGQAVNWPAEVAALQAAPEHKCREFKDRFVFYAPVLAAPAYSGDSLYFAGGAIPPAAHEVIGYVAVVVSKKELARVFRSIVRNSTALMILFLLISVAGTYFVVRAVTRPLSRLLTDIGTHGIQVKSGDELGMLHDTFTSMIETLSRSFATIYDLKAGLETKVYERTLALADRQKFLEATNSRLERTLLELRETQAQLIHSGKMAALGQLAAGVAHEINNTVNFISGALPPLKRRLAGLKNILAKTDKIGPDGVEAAAEYQEVLAGMYVLLANIEEGARRTTSIVKDLRSFSRADEDEFSAADVHEILDSILGVLQHEYKNRIEIIKDYDRSLPPLFCLAGQINQVFMNILLNAVHAVAGQGTIRIRTWHEAGQTHISIKDSGPGIPAAILPRIFEPFFTTKEVGSGTGLGLGISYAIVQKHRGEIKVRSEAGQGAEFEVVI